MFKSVVPVNSNRHQGKKIRPISSFAFAGELHFASIMAHEFQRAASTYPIVFIEDTEADEFRPVVLLGLEPGKNLFVDADGKWNASYIPAIIRRYPFALARTAEEGVFSICIDEESNLIDDSEGLPLFDADGKPAEAMENVKRYLSELQQMEAFTKAFCAELKQLNMFTPLNMRVRDGNAVRNVTGLYALNEERLGNLSDQRFLEMRKKGYLPLIYGHLTSLAQIERLVMLKEGRTTGAVDNSQPV